MEKMRTINNIDLLVDCNSSDGIYFSEEFSKENSLSKGASILDIFKLFSRDTFRPLHLMWEIIDKCNFSCPFCYVVGHSRNETIRFVEIKNHIDVLIEQGLLYCLLTGGEVTLHPDFNEIYKYLKENGVFVSVYTNGSRIEKGHIELFKEYKPYKVEITIYGLSDSVFKNNTKSNLSASSVLKNIELLQKEGINIVCKTSINTMTIRELKDIQYWCQERDIKHYSSSEILDAYDNQSLAHFAVPENIKLDLEIDNAIKENGYLFRDEKSKKTCFSCGVGAYEIYINSKFELNPCMLFNWKKYGINIREIGMRESIKRVREFVLSVYGKPIIGCFGCESSSYCNMCPGTAAEVKCNDKIIGYKTNDIYCKNIQTNFKCILEGVEKYISNKSR